MEEKLLSTHDVLCIPEKDLPLIVLSRNYYSHFATEISIFDKSLWNHFMWCISPGKFVSQDLLLHEVPMVNYLGGKHCLKFWTCPAWKDGNKKMLIDKLGNFLKKPWYKRRYDFLQILGIKLHIRKLQIPWLKICSDWADEIKMLDGRYDEEHLTPGEVNEWCKANKGYEVYGKFFPSD